MQLWAKCVAILLLFFAIFHIILVVNRALDNFVGRVPIIKDILYFVNKNWTEIYVFTMIGVWGSAIYLLIKHEKSILNC